MKKLLYLLAFGSSLAMAATPARLIDGQVQFALAQVGDTILWTQAERNSVVASTFSASLVLLTATAQEQAIAQTGKFGNFSEFVAKRDQQNAGLVDLLNDTLAKITKLQAVAADNPKLDVSAELTALQARYAALKALVK